MSEDRRMEAEQRYIAGAETLAELAKALGVPLNTLKRWCKAGGWVKKREKARKRAMRKAVTRATDKKARELARLLEASDHLERALVLSAAAFAEAMTESPGDIVDGKKRAANLERVSKAVNMQVASRMLISGVLSAADREKIDLLRRKQEMEERKEAQAQALEQGGVTIRLEQAAEELSE